MPDSVSLVQVVAQSMGLKISAERLPAIAKAIEVAMKQVDSLRTSPTPMPDPTTFDAAWSARK